ncbi:MAG TPA: rhomboid family intramembrane serine protease [Actinomycetota bacterium]|nr:rhomboid family intramembrane serine protease [Actinomycetota bacterium]
MTMLIPVRDHNPGRHFPLVTIALVAANVLAFFYLGISEEVAFRFGAVPCDVLQRCDQLSRHLNESFPDRTSIVSIFTSMFMHGNLLHLGGNMLFLWVFGNNVEDQFGKVGFAVFYAVTGVAAAFSHFMLDPASEIPIIGASGAVSGILGAYYYLYPRARVTALVPLFFFFPINVSAKFVLGLWFLLQLFEGVMGLGALQEGGVAFWAHVGGFVAGYVITRVFHPARAPQAVLSRYA